MYASKHVVFIGPGPLPADLAAQLLGAEEARGTSQPRILRFYDSAAQAERAASQLFRRHIRAVVAGPEQPPAEAAWLRARHLEGGDLHWRVTLDATGPRPLRLEAIEQLVSLDWRLDGATADRAVLLRTSELDRPVLLRAPAVDAELAHRFLEACGPALSPAATVRHRHLAHTDVGAPILAGDLLPLALAVVDATDTWPGELPGRRRTPAR